MNVMWVLWVCLVMWYGCAGILRVCSMWRDVLNRSEQSGILYGLCCLA